MTLPLHLESLSGRLAPHVGLLQEFFADRDVPFGAPVDLATFAKRLIVPGPFNDEMSSMLRTIVYREEMNVNREELLVLLARTVGGAELDLRAEEVQESIGQLRLFTNVVLLSMRRRGFGGPSVDVRDSEERHEESSAHNVEDKRLASSSGDGIPANLPGMPLAATFSPVEVPGKLPAPRPEILDQSLGTHFDVPLEPSAPRDDQQYSPSGTLKLDSPQTAPPAPEPSVARAPVKFPPLHKDLLESSRKDRRLLSRPATVLASLVLLALALTVWFSRRPVPATATAQAGRDALNPRTRFPDKPAAFGAPVAGNTPIHAPGASPSPARTSRDGLMGNDPTGNASRGNAASEPPPQPGYTGDGLRGSEGSSNPVKPADVARAEGSVIAPNVGVGAEPVAPAETSSPINAARGASVPQERSARGRDGYAGRHGRNRGLFTVSSGVMSANLISAPAPDYPVLARMARVEGQVILQAVVSRNGSVLVTHALQGHHLLRGAAERAVKRWRYRPYLMDGRPTDVETVVFVNFRLHH